MVAFDLLRLGAIGAGGFILPPPALIAFEGPRGFIRGMLPEFPPLIKGSDSSGSFFYGGSFKAARVETTFIAASFGLAVFRPAAFRLISRGVGRARAKARYSLSRWLAVLAKDELKLKYF